MWQEAQPKGLNPFFIRFVIQIYNMAEHEYEHMS